MPMALLILLCNDPFPHQSEFLKAAHLFFFAFLLLYRVVGAAQTFNTHLSSILSILFSSVGSGFRNGIVPEPICENLKITSGGAELSAVLARRGGVMLV